MEAPKNPQETSSPLLKSLSLTSIESTESFNSDELEEETFETTPHDLYHEHPDMGKIRVLQLGEAVPCLTKFKRTKRGGLVAIRFRVSDKLEVTVDKLLDGTKKAASDPKLVNIASPVSSYGGSGPKKRTLFGESEDLTMDKDNQEQNFSQGSSPASSEFRHQAEWLANLESDFESIIVGGLDVSMRDKVAENMKNKDQLTPCQNSGVIHSLNYHVLRQFGRRRPNPDLCRSLADLLKKKIPDTFAVFATVDTDEFGLLPIKRRRGEGGAGDLSTRIGDNFYNKFGRVIYSKPVLASSDAEEMLDLSARKKTRKNYGLNPDKYLLASKICKSDFIKSQASFNVMEEETVLDEKLKICEKSRDYVQSKFRTLEPSSHILSMKSFWALPAGPKLLSSWFNWMVDGEQLDFAVTVEENLPSCLNMAQKVLSSKMGVAWDERLVGVMAIAEESHGNDTMVNIFVLRALGNLWKNKSQKALFIEGEDDLQDISSQPFVYVVKVNQFGESAFPEAVKLSVRIGNTVVFDNVSLPQALASVIHLMFCFNLLYPSDCDDLFEYIQRVLCSFGPISGARNVKGKLKRAFVEFHCSIGAIMLGEKRGKIREFVA